MQPDPRQLLAAAGIRVPPIGLYDVPDTKPFEPVMEAEKCVFAYYQKWLKGENLSISKDSFGCPGAGYWMCGVETRPRDQMVQFLVKTEGLKHSEKAMNEWLDHRRSYRQEHPLVVIGPLRDTQYDHLKTVTFFVNPDQLSLLMIGASYYHGSGDLHPVVAPFGSGCGQLAALFDDLDSPQALIGATDIAMRQHLPPDIMACTVTRSMFEQLCGLDEESFLYKPFWKNLMTARLRETVQGSP